MEYYIVNDLRKNGIITEVFLDQDKSLKKQLQYADRKNIKLAIIMGENEYKKKQVLVKKLRSSKENDQVTIPIKNIVNEIKKFI